MFDLLGRSHGRRVAGRAREGVWGGSGERGRCLGPRGHLPKSRGSVCGVARSRASTNGRITEKPKSLFAFLPSSARGVLSRVLLASSLFLLGSWSPARTLGISFPPPPARLSFKGVTAVALGLFTPACIPAQCSVCSPPVLTNVASA